MKRAVSTLVFLYLTCCVSSQAMALGMEHLGNEPLNEANYRSWKGVMPLVNHDARVYHTWVNGNEHFYYRGDTPTLNDALRKFAATESKVHEVVLRPAPGIVHSFNKAKLIPFNWSLYLRGGIAQHLTTLDKATCVWSKYPVLTVYVGGDIDLDTIKVPDGITVLELSDLRERCLKGLESTDKTARGWGAGVLARLDPYNAESMTAVAKLLGDEESWVRLNAAGALAVFGKKAESAIPALETCLAMEYKGLKARAQETIEKIQQAKDTSTAEAEHRTILRRISRFQTSLKQTVEQSEHASTPSETEQAAYLGPSDVVASADGKTLYVVNVDARQVAVVDVAGGNVRRSIDMPAEPTGLVLGPDGATLYVTCAAPEGTIAVVDIESGKLRESMPAGHWPIGPAISPDGRTLYVCNRFDNNVAVVDLQTGNITLVPTTREPYAAAVTPDGKSVFVVNHLPIGRADTYEVASVVTVIDTATNETQTIRLPIGSTGMRGICVSPDGKHVYVTHLLSRYQMPTTQLERGWMNTNALTIIDASQKKRINTVLLDDVDLGAANPWGVALTADGRSICVTQAGTHEMSIIDAVALIEKLTNMPATKEEAREAARKDDRETYSSATAADVPNDLRFLFGLRRRVLLTTGKPHQKPTVNGPRGLAVVESKAFVAGYFTDNLAVVDLEPKPGDPEPSDLVSTIALGNEPRMSVQRRGEMLFNDATLCHQHWQSCDSCHPDARVDALNWDLMNDGMGNPKNVRSMLLAHQTQPSMSLGVLSDASAAVRSEVTHLLFAIPTEENALAIDEYLKSLKPVASPYLVDGKLSPAAQRGKQLFFDAKINCAKCHPEPLFTDMLMHDVVSRGRYDRHDAFDTPTLIESWRTAPYMHDGRYTTVNELLRKGKHGNEGGEIDKLNTQQIDDLAEYVLSLGDHTR